MFVRKDYSHFAVFPGFEEGKEGKRKIGEQGLSGVVFFLIEERFSGFVGVYLAYCVSLLNLIIWDKVL